jgi:haloalkane dehalogenase
MRTDDGCVFLRTPDANFTDLPEFPWTPHYHLFEGLRLHYIDEGPRDAPVALLMHGMPTWCFLNRRIIAPLLAAGYRCIAADHIGFGRSDKVVDDGWYSIERHVRAHHGLIEALDLRHITLFCQDWGGPIGLAQAANLPDRFARLVIMNTWLHHREYEYTPALRQWNAQWQDGGMFATHVPERLSIGWFMLAALRKLQPAQMIGLIQNGVHPEISPELDAIRRGYDAPFAGLGRAGHAGPRRFPLSLPFYDPVGGAAALQARWYAELLGWTRPVHFIWGGSDDVFTEQWGRLWASRCPQATFDFIPETGHFLQENAGAQIAQRFLDRTR